MEVQNQKRKCKTKNESASRRVKRHLWALSELPSEKLCRTTVATPMASADASVDNPEQHSCALRQQRRIRNPKKPCSGGWCKFWSLAFSLGSPRTKVPFRHASDRNFGRAFRRCRTAAAKMPPLTPPMASESRASAG